MTTENFCFYLQNRLIQASQTGGQWYSDTSPFSIPWPNTLAYCNLAQKKFYSISSRHTTLKMDFFIFKLKKEEILNPVSTRLTKY